jgi:hypothetical protein
LAPGFISEAGDEAAPQCTTFRLSALDATGATADQRKKYRYYIADECDDGHLSIATDSWVTGQPIDFKALFTVNDANGNPPPDDAPPNYVKRYRPGRMMLFSKDLLNRPRKAQLALSRNYTGADPPCMWDSVSGDWQEIDGGWSLLYDRLGVEITADNPDEWNVGKPPAGQTPSGTPWPAASGILRGIASLSNPDTSGIQYPTGGGPGYYLANARFWLRLTTVIQGDFGIEVEAQRRNASPMKNAIQRRVDAKDHFYYDAVDGSSPFSTNPGPSGPDSAVVVQDDTKAATVHACQLRTAHEFPPLTAAVTIPMFETGYEVGDRISRINGRDVSLLVNAGVEQGEAKSYPFIVAKTWDFQGNKQATTLQLSDRRLEPQHVR